MEMIPGHIKQRKALLAWGEAVPLFEAPTPKNAQFKFGSVGGRYIILVTLPPLGSELADKFLAEFAAAQMTGDDGFLVAFAVTPEKAAWTDPKVRQAFPRDRIFLDEDGKLLGALGARTETGIRPHWLLLDPDLRVMRRGSLAKIDILKDAVGDLESIDLHAGQERVAPILIVPRVLTSAFCDALIEEYHRVGAKKSGYMIEVDGKTVGARDDRFKRRFDAKIQTESLIIGLQRSLMRNLFDQIHKAYGFMPTRIERYIVACYTAEEQGFFGAHRDNTTAGTAHRRFAVTLNLSDDYDGGTLTFPEFGTKQYRAPKGGALVFGCSLLHQANPVTRGKRYATLPFLYDDAAAKIRQDNFHLLQNAGNAIGESEAQAKEALSQKEG